MINPFHLNDLISIYNMAVAFSIGDRVSFRKWMEKYTDVEHPDFP